MVCLKYTILPAALLAPLLFSSAGSALAVARTTPKSTGSTTLVTVTKVEAVVYAIEVNGYFAANGTYPVDSDYTLTVTNAPTSVDLSTYATSTKTTTFNTTVTGHHKSNSTVSTSTTIYDSFSSSASATSTSSAATSSASVATKTGVSNCNVQGTASGMTVRDSPATAAGFVDCQTSCFADTPCESFSYDPSTKICTKYLSALHVTPGNTGVFFSAKYPADGSNFCYGTAGY